MSIDTPLGSTRPPLTIFVDADGCPVKQEIYKVARRHGALVKLVANSWLRPQGSGVEAIVVGGQPDAADDWIVDNAQPNDIVVTSDIPLAARCVKKGAHVLSPSGRTFDEDSIGEALATRDLLTHLRDRGEVTRGPAPFDKRTRSRFLQRLEETIQAARRRKG